MSDVTLVDVDTQLVIGMKKTGKYAEIATMIPKVVKFAMEKGAQIQGSPVFICHETSAEAAKEADEKGTAEVEVVVPVAGSIEENDEIKCFELPGGKMAKIIHKGPYQECGPTYEKLFGWLGQNNKNIAGPTREVYLNDPREVAESELLTEIYAPIE